MKTKGFVLIIIFSLLLRSTALAYDTFVTGSIYLPEKVKAISVNPSTGIAAATSRQTNTLFLIDTYKNSIIKKIPLDFSPSSVSIDTERNLAIVSSSEGMLNFIDLETAASVMKISVGRAIHAIALNEADKTLFIGNSESLLKMDIGSGKIINEVSLQHAVKDMAVDYKKGWLFIAFEGKEGLSLYDLKTVEHMEDIQTGGIPSGVSVNPSTNIALISNSTGKSVTIISTDTRDTLGTVAFDGHPEAVAIDKYRNMAFIAHEDRITALKLQNPVPAITDLIPESAQIGNSGLTLSIKGSRFIKDSKTRFDIKELPTVFEDNYSLKAVVPSDELLTQRDIPVSVINPLPGGGESNTMIFRVINPFPHIDSITPDTVAVGSVFNLRVSGKNFYNGSTIILNEKTLKTRFISSILLEAVVDQEHTQNPGVYPVIVKNPSGFVSNQLSLSIIEKDAMRVSKEDKEDPNKGTGSLRGRILNTYLEPLEGVSLKVKGLKTETDSSGYFLLENIPAGKHVLLIDGSTKKGKINHYPTIPINVDIEPGVINEMPFQVYLHKQKNWNFKDINPNEDTILTDPEVPGFEMRIPKGVNIIGWDGKPNVKVSVRTVPTDRLPIKPLPQNANVRTVYMFYFDKIGGGTPDMPIPIKAKNDLDLLPGEKAVLWYYDESPIEGEAPNDWAIAGTGTVTPDGQYIVSDPGVGIPKFCCGATAWGGTSSNTDKTGPEGPCGQAGDPVDLATGYFVHEKTDLHIPGIIPVNIKRYYTSKDKNNNEPLGAFGRNTSFEYDWWMGAYDANGNINNSNPTMYLLIKPGNYQYRFPRQADGTFINTTDPAMRGAVVTKNPDNSRILRMRDGWTYKFDSSGKLIEISDRNGNKLTLTRRSDFEGGYLRSITTAEGKTITFTQTYTGNFYRTDSITDDTGRTVKYTYDTYNSYPRLIKVEYPDGGTIQYKYDSSGRMSEIINERGVREVLNEYDSNNRVIKQTHADGGIYTFNYTTAGGNITETTMTEPNGAVTTWRFYNATGAYRDKYITKKITPDGETKYERQAGTNLLLSVTDPLGRKMSYTYYPNGLIKTETDNLGNTTSYEYESIFGLPTKITDPLGKATTIAYTFSGGKVTKAEIRDPLLNLTTINYNSFGMPTSIIDPNNNTTTFYYENTGRPTELTRIRDPLGNEFRLTYDSLGRLISQTDAKGNTTLYNYDVMGRITSVTDPIGNVTRYFYDLRGNLAMLIDARNNMIRYEYDNRDRLKKMTDQLGRFETYEYDTSDNLTKFTDRKGQTTTYTYDLMKRIKRITYNDGSFTEYTYDKVGRVDYINDSISGFIDYVYNDFGRLLFKIV